MSGPVIVAGVRPALTVEQQMLADCQASSFKAVGLHSEAMNDVRAAIAKATGEQA